MGPCGNINYCQTCLAKELLPYTQNVYICCWTTLVLGMWIDKGLWKCYLIQYSSFKGLFPCTNVTAICTNCLSCVHMDAALHNFCHIFFPRPSLNDAYKNCFEVCLVEVWYVLLVISSPLIRIVGDRFPWQVKSAILSTLSIMIRKGGIALKPFLPQLQTTFVKCLQDNTRSVRLDCSNISCHICF